MPASLPVKKSLSVGLTKFKETWKFFLTSFILFGLLNFIPGIFLTLYEKILKKPLFVVDDSGIPQNISESFFASMIYIIIFIIVQVITFEMIIGFIKSFLNIVDGKIPIIADLFRCFPLFFRFLSASVQYTFISFAGILFFIAPGIIWAVKYCFYSFFIIDRECSPVESIYFSSQTTKGNIKSLFGYFLLIFLINLTGPFIFFIISFVTLFISESTGAYAFAYISGGLMFFLSMCITAPISGISMAYLYRNLLKKSR